MNNALNESQRLQTALSKKRKAAVDLEAKILAMKVELSRERDSISTFEKNVIDQVN